MKLVTSVIVLSTLQYFSSALLDSTTLRFIEEYFIFKTAKIITIFTCSQHDAFRLQKALTTSAGKFWVVTPDPSKPIDKAIDHIIMRTYNKFGIFVDYDCDAGKDYLFENSERRSLNDSYNWLVWSEKDSPKVAEDLNLHFDTDMTWAKPDDDLIILHDLYKINYSWPLNSTFAGFWEPGKGITYTLKQYKYARRQDMRGVILTAGLAVNNIPLDDLKGELEKPKNRKMDAMATYNYRIFTMLAQFYNFSSFIKNSHLYGYVVENGREEGLILMLKNHDVEYSISAIQTNRARYRCTDFISVPTWKFRIVALFRHPPVTGYYGQVLLQPFETNVWTTSAGMWAIVILTIRFVSWVEIKTFDFVPTSNEDETVRSWSDTLMIMIGAISEQGTTMDSKWTSWRIGFLAAFILSMMVNINYGASLVSSLLSTPPKSIKTTRDLIDSQLTFGAEDISYNVPFFALNSDPLIHELYKKKMAPPHQAYWARDVALRKMRKEYFAFHTEAIKVYPEIEDNFTPKEKCELSEVLVFVPEKCYNPIPWGSPHKEAFTFAMRKISENGLVNYQDRIWFIPKPSCTIKEEFVSVDMDKISPAFLIVLAGVFVSSLLMMFEIFSHRKKNAQNMLQAPVPVQVKVEKSAKPRETDVFRQNYRYFSQRGNYFD
ncbi:Ionotropic receptor 75x [Blattella germanica]|nr:Ionotropic receptor 75x [Blattella germanica]